MGAATRQRSDRDRARDRWRNMILRCSNPTDSGWRNYGGRGICVCPEWRSSFDSYYDHVGDAPVGMSLDRIDNDGNYEPGNVRWATFAAQALNQREPNALKTHCREDHPYDTQNTYVDPRGERQCRTCRSAATARYRRNRVVMAT